MRALPRTIDDVVGQDQGVRVAHRYLLGRRRLGQQCGDGATVILDGATRHVLQFRERPSPGSVAVVTAPGNPAQPSLLVDGLGRRARDLRISLSQDCTLRCHYCMPAEGLPLLAREELLSVAEVPTCSTTCSSRACSA